MISSLPRNLFAELGVRNRQIIRDCWRVKYIKNVRTDNPNINMTFDLETGLDYSVQTSEHRILFGRGTVATFTDGYISASWTGPFLRTNADEELNLATNAAYN